MAVAVAVLPPLLKLDDAGRAERPADVDDLVDVFAGDASPERRPPAAPTEEVCAEAHQRSGCPEVLPGTPGLPQPQWYHHQVVSGEA